MVSRATYDIHSPPPIYITGCYWIKASQLPDEFTPVFSDTDRADDAALPTSGSFSASCFRNIVNDHFATSDYIIPSEDSKETQALLPKLRQTMEVVGDDELELTYDEWVYLTTGWYPKNNKSQLLGSRARRAAFSYGTLLLDNADNDAPVRPYGVFTAMHNYGFNRNLIAVEPSFLCIVGGVWEVPNSDAIYDTDWTYGGISVTRGQAANPSATTLDRGSPHTVDLFRNSKAWIADPTSEDIIGASGSGSSARASINYWLNGEVRFDRDLDPRRIRHSTGADTDLTLSQESTNTEGGEAYETNVNVFIGLAELQHFPD